MDVESQITRYVLAVSVPENFNEAMVTNKILQDNLPLTSPNKSGVVTFPSIFTNGSSRGQPAFSKVPLFFLINKSAEFVNGNFQLPVTVVVYNAVHRIVVNCQTHNAVSRNLNLYGNGSYCLNGSYSQQYQQSVLAQEYLYSHRQRFRIGSLLNSLSVDELLHAPRKTEHNVYKQCFSNIRHRIPLFRIPLLLAAYRLEDYGYYHRHTIPFTNSWIHQQMTYRRNPNESKAVGSVREKLANQANTAKNRPKPNVNIG